MKRKKILSVERKWRKNLQMTANMKVKAGMRFPIAEESVGEL
jgi:hypothetical protein